MSPPKVPAKQRLAASVERGPKCWLWTGGLSSNGYGKLSDDNGRTVGAHRLSYEIARGPIPEGLFVLHKCDVRNCVRPSHLFLGTQKQNMEDKVFKGREARGERHGSKTRPKTRPETTQKGSRNPASKLTEAEVKAIRSYASSGARQTSIAAMFGITQALVSLIVRREAWKHV